MNQKKKELEQNELADILAKKIEALKPHANMIAIVSIGGIAIIAALIYLISTLQMAQSEKWRELYVSLMESERTGDIGPLEDVSSRYADSNAGMLALQISADIELQRGLGQLVTDPDNSARLIRSAQEKFRTIVDSPADLDSLARRRSFFSLAYSHESLGEFDEAKKYYMRIKEEAPDSPIAKEADRGLSRVSNPKITNIYQHYTSWSPEETAPGPVLPPRPDISFPEDEPAVSPEAGVTPPGDSGTDDAPGNEPDDTGSSDDG